MTWFLDTALVAAAVGLVGGALVPQLVARLPEPAPDPEDQRLEPAANESDFSRPVDEPKELYTEVAALPGLRWKAAGVASVAGGLLGARTGWTPALVFLLYLVPVCIALSVVDWRTRYLPTRLIAPSYLVVAVLALLAAAVTGDWSALGHAVIGWLSAFGFFWLLWRFLPAGGMAYGDVRLAGLLGLAVGWVGLPQLALGLYTAFLLGGVVGVLLSLVRVFHHRHSPFGPHLVLGAWLGVVFPAQLAAGYGAVVNGLVSLVSR